ncbi:MAG: hypothetical protein ED559_08660 [Phycisphaera sp.]|nr:MAG: hypothetical protein ED559_08660 [Phycisphaera sp.]
MIRSVSLLALAMCAGAASSQQVLPADFENNTKLDRLFAFGGVTSFQTAHSPRLVYEETSYQLDIAFSSASSLNFSNVGLGVLDTGISGFQLDSNADVFSITVLAPADLPGGLELIVTLRDDDNNDGQVDITSDDDEWISDPIAIADGLAIYNVPISSFTDGNPGAGNDTTDFSSGPAGGMVLTFQTSTSLPEGRIVTPITLFIDHAGVFIGEQTIPGDQCLADVNDDGTLSPTDFTAWLNVFNNQSPECDQNGDNTCTPTDFTAWITNFNAGC